MKYLIYLFIFILVSTSVVANSENCDWIEVQEIPYEETYYVLGDDVLDSVEPFYELIEGKVWKESPGYTLDYTFGIKNLLEYPLET